MVGRDFLLRIPISRGRTVETPGMTEKSNISVAINGLAHRIAVEPRRRLADAIRGECGQTGTHIGCGHGICGACTVMVDGEPTRK